MDPEALARLHARCFTDAPRPWSADEFRELLDNPSVVLAVAPDGSAFAMARRVGPEAEILTICTDPDARRCGMGRMVLRQILDRARAAGVEVVLLEVADTNTAARALYTAEGFVEAGFRKDYYARKSERSVSALVLRKSL